MTAIRNSKLLMLKAMSAKTSVKEGRELFFEKKLNAISYYNPRLAPYTNRFVLLFNDCSNNIQMRKIVMATIKKILEQKVGKIEEDRLLSLISALTTKLYEIYQKLNIPQIIIDSTIKKLEIDTSKAQEEKKLKEADFFSSSDAFFKQSCTAIVETGAELLSTGTELLSKIRAAF